MAVARDIMTREVVSTRPSCRVEEVTRVLYFHGISGLPVIDDSHMVIGMVTEADILGRTTGQDTIRDIMSSPAVTIAEDASLEEIAGILSRKKIKRVPRPGRPALRT
jgi:CBS-domain-containing membrane protein